MVTSLGAAALRDVATALSRRVPHLPVTLFPASVQGAQAPAELCAALQAAYAQHAATGQPEVLLLVRGGGSLEDLWSFNEAVVVRAIAAAPVPVVVGVGHETDFTLADFVADLRAPTPTAAAELCAPARGDLLAVLELLDGRLQRAAHDGLDLRAQQLDRLAQRLGRPAGRLTQSQRQLQVLQGRLERLVHLGAERQRLALQRLNERLPQGVARQLLASRQRLDHVGQSLALLDPALVLQRGYAWLTDDAGQAITRVAQAEPGQAVRAVLADGELGLTVERLTTAN